jgi:cardiolipin-specific phospholipase
MLTNSSYPVGVPQRVDDDDEKRISSLPFYIRTMIHGVRTLFNQGVTPGSFLRSLPYSKSRSMVETYIVNRLPSITCEHERSSLGEYLYQNSMLPGSGEYCLNEILTAGAFAKVPLLDRIPNLQSSISSSDGGKNDDGTGLEIHFVYGENDWMDYRGGLDVQRLCHQKKALLSQSTQQLSSPSPPTVFVHGVRSAGHLLMLENYQEFNAAMAIAAGKNEEELTRLGMSRPVEFVCNEVADARSKTTAQFRSNSGKIVMRNEEDAAMFFRGGRWNRQRESSNNNAAQIADEGK